MFSSFIKKTVDDTSGATAIEYGLILALIALAMIGALTSFAGTAIAMWNDVATRVVAATGA
jgi:pilus assembly protein Flp/PilA